MNDSEKSIFDAIKGWVWSGFYDAHDIQKMVHDLLEEGCDENMLLAAIEPELEKKRLAEKDWPEITDVERLLWVFYKLTEEGICALHNTGYTISDGFDDVDQKVSHAPEGYFHGFCFYHGQDVAGAVKGRGLRLAYGALGGDSVKSLSVGKSIVAMLEHAGFSVDWDGSVETRIFLPDIKWQKRG